MSASYPPQSRSLHPNLAKIAAQYDEIASKYALNQIDAETARALVSELEARDDNGVRWLIDPGTGTWLRKTAFGDLVHDPNPPTFGLATRTARTVSEFNGTFDPAERVTMHELAGEADPGPYGLGGSTYRQMAQEQAIRQPRTRVHRWLWPAVAVAAAVAIVALFLATH